MEYVIIFGGILLLVLSLIYLLYKRKIKEKSTPELKCTACGKLSCMVITQNQLGHIEPGGNFKESGYLNSFLLSWSETPFEDWIIGEQDKYSCCKECGYFEKLSKELPNK